MATQPLRTACDECPGCRLTLGGDTTVNRLGSAPCACAAPGVWGDRSQEKRSSGWQARADACFRARHHPSSIRHATGPQQRAVHLPKRSTLILNLDIVKNQGGLRLPLRDAWKRRGADRTFARRLRGKPETLAGRIDIYQLHAPNRKVPLLTSLWTRSRTASEGRSAHRPLHVSVMNCAGRSAIAPIVLGAKTATISPTVAEDVLAECEKGELSFLPWHRM